MSCENLVSRTLCSKSARKCATLHYKYDKCQTLHDGSTHKALPIHTTFSDLDCISRSQQCQTVLTENFMFLFN